MDGRLRHNAARGRLTFGYTHMGDCVTHPYVSDSGAEHAFVSLNHAMWITPYVRLRTDAV